MTEIYKSDISPFALTKWDLVEGLKQWRIWTNLAYGEIHALYGRTIIGVSWNIISFALFSLAIIAIFGGFSDTGVVSEHFGPHVVVGYLVYTYVSGMVMDACEVFAQNETWLKAGRLPYGLFIYKGITKNLILLVFNTIAALSILIFFFDLQFHKTQLLIIPAFFIILFNGVAAYMAIGSLCARYRDLGQLIITVMRFAFFITPIMWEVGTVGMRGKISIYNPLTHFIEIIRQPVLHGTTATFSWIVVFGITIFIWIFGLCAYAFYRKKIIYWV